MHQFHKQIYNHHDVLAKFINYYLRELAESDKPILEKQYGASLYVILDKIADKMRHLSERIDTYNITPKVYALLEEALHFFSEQFIVLEKKELSTEFNNKRYNLVRKVTTTKYTYEEFQVIAELKPFLDTLTNFVEYQFAKTIKEHEREL